MSEFAFKESINYLGVCVLGVDDVGIYVFGSR